MNYTHRFYHLEEMIIEENDQNKDSVFIPVAHYIKVRNHQSIERISFLFSGKFYSN